jgi:hypothetical protein
VRAGKSSFVLQFLDQSEMGPDDLHPLVLRESVNRRGFVSKQEQVTHADLLSVRTSRRTPTV